MEKFIMDASKVLNLKDPAYKNAVKLYVWQAYLNDAGKGDATTDLFVANKRQKVTAEIIAKETGILSGMQEAEWFLKKLNIKIIQKKKDGSRLKKGDLIMRLLGSADKILACERTLLNLLQRMSGVATKTDELVKKIPRSIKLLATRKTLWGELDKRAVSIGGGASHRLNLSDAALIKENHIALISDFKKFHSGFRKAKKLRFIEIELEDIKQVMTFAIHFEKTVLPKVVVMLDNFKPAEVKKAVTILNNSGVLIEVSGGVNEKNIKSYAVKGVSAISSGAITNKAPSLDFSLLITK